MSVQNLRVGIAGVAGRMGKALVSALSQEESACLSLATETHDHPQISHNAYAVCGLDAQQCDTTISNFTDACWNNIDVLIDFTSPKATMAHLDQAQKKGFAMVIGTTGMNEENLHMITKASNNVPIVFAPNMSIGINVMFYLAAAASKLLGANYDIEIMERHHRHKKDAPSGTALKLGDILANSTNTKLDQVAEYSRHGKNLKRDKNTIGFCVSRGGTIVGDHTVLFAGGEECLEITHRASGRENYSEGAIRAAHFLQNKKSGLI